MLIENAQRSIIAPIRTRFNTVNVFSFNPFWYCRVCKARLPQVLRRRVPFCLRAYEDFLMRRRRAGGAFVSIKAKKQ